MNKTRLSYTVTLSYFYNHVKFLRSLLLWSFFYSSVYLWKKAEKLCTKSNKHEIWHSSSLGDKKWFKPQTQQKPPFCVFYRPESVSMATKKIFSKIYIVIYRWEAFLEWNKKLIRTYIWKQTGNELHAF